MTKVLRKEYPRVREVVQKRAKKGALAPVVPKRIWLTKLNIVLIFLGLVSSVVCGSFMMRGSADFTYSQEQVSSVADEYRNTTTVKPDAYVPIPKNTPQNNVPASPSTQK